MLWALSCARILATKLGIQFALLPGSSDLFSAGCVQLYETKLLLAAASSASFRGVHGVYLLLVFPRILDNDKHNAPFSSWGPDMGTYTTAEYSLSLWDLPFLQTQPEPLRKVEVVTSKHPMHGRAENLMQTICVFCYRKMQS